MKRLMISCGDFLFKYRNYVFPLYILVLFVLFLPDGAPFHRGHHVEHILDAAAVLLAFAGLALRGVVIGLAYIKRGGLNKKVYADNLVTEGMFAVCRNPLYVGNMLIYAGEFLLFGDNWCFAVGVLSFWIAYECIIATEENFLRNKFGAAYDEYCRDVPRWWIKWSKIPAATAGMEFDWRKVLFKDYSTMQSTMVVLALILCWKLLAHGGIDHGCDSHSVELLVLLALIVGVSLAAVLVRRKKKSAARAAG